jgi:outer membrane lipopolysaccharide assembly protein LptE/RlpB
MKQKIYYILITAGMFLLHSGCGFYSHTGASVPADAKTFSVAYIPNVASIVSPSLSQQLTEKLKLKFINETSLKLTTETGDLHFSGKITSYTTAPVAVQANQTNATNRLTVSVEIVFENHKDEKKNFTQVFTAFTDFPADQSFAAQEQSLNQKITDQLVQDVFNKAFINW